MARYQVGIETKARILEATRSLLADGGLDATTLKAICDRAKVRSGSFYNLFGSKEDAIIHVVRESIRAVDPDPDRVGTDTVDDLVDAYSRFLQEEPEMARVYVSAALAGESTADSARRQSLRPHIRRADRRRAPTPPRRRRSSAGAARWSAAAPARPRGWSTRGAGSAANGAISAGRSPRARRSNRSRRCP